MLEPEPAQPSYASPFHFALKIVNGGDPLTTQTTNRVLRPLPIAGLAMLAVLRDDGVEHGVDVESLKEAYRERAARRETTQLAINVRLSPVGVDAISCDSTPYAVF